MSRLTAFTRAWYAQELLRELVLIYPVYAIMIGDAGVSPFELSLLFFAWSATGILLEVPSGALADRVSRRNLIVAGQLLKAACFFIWWLYPGFTGYLVGFVCWGIGGSLRSGTAESLLHDRLRELGSDDLFEKVYGRSMAWSAASVTVAMALGGWAAHSGYGWPLVLSVAAPLATALVVALYIDDPPRSSGRAAHEPYLATLRAGLHEVRHSATLRRPFLFLCTAAVFYEAGEEYFGPLLAEKNFSLIAIGLISALLNLARAGGAVVAERWRDRGGDGVLRRYLAAGALLGLAALAGSWWAIAALTLFVGITCATSVTLQADLQRSIAGHARATITSAAGLGQELTGLALFLAIGAVATKTAWATSFLCLAGALIVVAVVVEIGPGRRNAERDAADVTRAAGK